VESAAGVKVNFGEAFFTGTNRGTNHGKIMAGTSKPKTQLNNNRKNRFIGMIKNKRRNRFSIIEGSSKLFF